MDSPVSRGAPGDSTPARRRRRVCPRPARGEVRRVHKSRWPIGSRLGNTLRAIVSLITRERCPGPVVDATIGPSPTAPNNQSSDRCECSIRNARCVCSDAESQEHDASKQRRRNASPGNGPSPPGSSSLGQASGSELSINHLIECRVELAALGFDVRFHVFELAAI
jgi:hypothetical protein